MLREGAQKAVGVRAKRIPTTLKDKGDGGTFPRLKVPSDQNAVAFLAAQIYTKCVVGRDFETEEQFEDVLHSIRRNMIRLKLHENEELPSRKWREEALCKITDICLLTGRPFGALKRFAITYNELLDAHNLISNGGNLFGTGSAEDELKALMERAKSFVDSEGLEELYGKAVSIALENKGKGKSKKGKKMFFVTDIRLSTLLEEKFRRECTERGIEFRKKAYRRKKKSDGLGVEAKPCLKEIITYLKTVLKDLFPEKNDCAKALYKIIDISLLTKNPQDSLERFMNSYRALEYLISKAGLGLALLQPKADEYRREIFLKLLGKFVSLDGLEKMHRSASNGASGRFTVPLITPDEVDKLGRTITCIQTTRGVDSGSEDYVLHR